MQFLYPFVISFLMTLAAMNLPAHLFSVKQLFTPAPKLGAAFTQVLSTDTLSDFPTVYNTNLGVTANTTTVNSFSSLVQFVGNASSSKSSCYGLCYFGATATSSFGTDGALTLITPLTVANGGTGSTTLSSNQVLLGNGTGNVGTVSGWGTDNQVLTSAGGTAAPAWETAQSDQSLNYSWTGNQRFALGATTTILVASSTPTNPLILNTVSYSTPSTQGAASTTLINNGSGLLTWEKPDWTLILATTTEVVKDTVLLDISTASSTYIRMLLSMPEKADTADNGMRFNSQIGGSEYSARRFTDAGAAVDSTTSKIQINSANDTLAAHFDILIMNIKSRRKTVSWTGTLVNALATAPNNIRGSGVWDNSTSTITTITLFGNGTNVSYPAGTYIEIYGSKN